MKTKIIFLLVAFLSIRISALAQSGPACDASGTLSITTTNISQPTCEGGNNGSINLSVSGPPGVSFTYTLTGAASNPPPPAVSGSPSHTFENLEAIGFYVLEVRTPINPSDPNTNYYSCVQIINMPQPPAIEVSGSPTPPTCASGSDGNVSISISNGTAPYQVSWSDGGSGTSRNNLQEGSYTATVTDANGCTGSGSFSVTDPEPITLTPSTTPSTCNGDNDGSVSFSASGGTAPYTYSSSAGGSGNTASDLSPGTYSVSVTDAAGCEASSSFTITEPPVISAIVSPIPPLKCNGDNNRDVTITGTGGTAPYTYTMEGTEGSQSGTNATFGNNGESSGSILVEDANGCSVSVPFSVSGPPPVEFPLSMTEDNCSEGSGGIQAPSFASGGNGGPYTYEYSTGGPYTPFSPPRDFGLTDGITTAGQSVSVQITDREGCVSTFGSTIDNLPRAVPYIRIERNPCIGSQAGSITVDSVRKNASVPSYTFFMAPDNGVQNFVSQPGSGPKGESAHFGNLSSGGYIMQIEDGKPCGPYAVSEFYLWNGTGYELVTAGSLYTRDDGTGVDTVSASSVTNPDHAVMQVIDPDSLSYEVVTSGSEYHGTTGLIWVYDVQGGSPRMINGMPAYQMAVDNPAHLQYYLPKDTIVNGSIRQLYSIFGPYAPGKHVVYISDQFGCTDTITVTISGNFFIPNLITPNGDGSNETFEIISLPPFSSLQILNRWGDRVYNSSNYDNGFGAENLSDGVYYYELELNSGQRFKGWLQVLR